jgi:CRISPR type IV-associated protein Csf3
MQSPKIVLGSPWLSFDGIIAYLLVRERLGQDYWTLPSKQPIDVSPYLQNPPIKRTGELWHASVAQFPPEAKVGVTKFYKRFDERNCHIIQTTIKKLQIDRGHYRAYMMNIAHVTTSKVWFYVNGNIEEVYRLISNLAGLGKKVVDGCGWFHSVSVEKMDKDYSLSKDGLAMRPLPCKFGYKSDVVMRLAWRSPYWDKCNVAVCVPPGEAVFT